MACVSTVTYSVLINDQAFGLIIPERGLREGDPLSPFLFVLCTEGLSFLLEKAQNERLIEGISFGEEGPVINHLLFADDSLFMCKATVVQSKNLQEILKKYEAATGQFLNKNKSSISFGAKVSVSTRLEIQGSLGIFNQGGAGSYLGLPECMSGSKVKLLSFLKDKLQGRLAGWTNRFLSQGGKEILLKSVALSLPVFTMSCFKLPKSTCKMLSSAMADFWWNSSDQSRKIHWKSWESLCLPKTQGGMGFKDLEAFNQSLLAKQAWRIVSEPGSLFSKFMKSRYFENKDFLIAGMGIRPSFAWRSILFGRELLIKGLVKKIGNGESIQVWIDKWIEDKPWKTPLRKNIFINVDLKVSDLLDHASGSWNRTLLSDLFYPEDQKKILRIKPVIEVEDSLIWNFNKSGDFTVKSGYWLATKDSESVVWNLARSSPSLNGLKSEVWKVPTEKKIKVFIWKMLNGALAVGDCLTKRGLMIDKRCQKCGCEIETINHVLFSCPAARVIWVLAEIPSPAFGLEGNEIFANLQHLFQNRKNNSWPALSRRCFPWILWRIWKNRNSFVFEGKSFLPLESIRKIREDTEEWFTAQRRDGEHGEFQRNIDNEILGVSRIMKEKIWTRPEKSWLKCNVGVSWTAKDEICGSSWIVRNEYGNAILHSRRAFIKIKSRDDAFFLSLLWAIESMHSHRLNKVSFEIQNDMIVSMIRRPKAWPAFLHQSNQLIEGSKQILQKRFGCVECSENIAAFLIAKSARKDSRLNSYVAIGFPFWLRVLFDRDKVQSSGGEGQVEVTGYRTVV